MQDWPQTLKALPDGAVRGFYHSLVPLERAGMGRISRLPLSLRVILESMVRNLDGVSVTREHVRALAGWQPGGARDMEIPFVVARIIAPDSSGIPLLADLAAMREAASRLGREPARVEPRARVDFIVDHSVQVDHAGSPDALRLNMELEFARNGERYQFIKWAAGAFGSLRIVPPGAGIIHQVNLESWAPGVLEKDGVYYPDTLVGADSHTAMINALGVVGWGVGGIEAEAAMLGQPVYIPTPDVVGVELKGRMRAGITATDAVLTVTQRLRAAGVVGKFVEFFGEGAASLAATDRATIANMAPEYGATLAYFPVDENTLAYFRDTGRSDAQLAAIRAYFTVQGWFGMPRRGAIDYSSVLEIDLAQINASVAGPRRPQDRLDLGDLGREFATMLAKSVDSGGFGKRDAALSAAGSTTLGDGSVVLAAITSCTNTSNPGVLVAAGLLAKKAVERGLRTHPGIKTSFAPGSRVVPQYLARAGLQSYLDALGFHVVGYGCTTCIGNSGPLAPEVEREIASRELVVASVLSGNRNFEARIHPAIKANFLMSPPLVVAFALAGRVTVDLEHDPLGHDPAGQPVYLRDLWPAPAEIASAMASAADPELFRAVYGALDQGNDLWDGIAAREGPLFPWDAGSDYLRRPPFFDDFTEAPGPIAPIAGARALLLLGDSVTTDHISPGGAIGIDTAAGRYLLAKRIATTDFNTYIGRRGNHEVMMRGTWANVRLRNRMVPGSEGGVTVHHPGGERMSVYDAAMAYARENVPLVVFAGAEYGTGSSRDWAAKGTRLLGVRAVIAQSYERIHRSNLAGMGVLPLEYLPGDSAATLGITGNEAYDIVGIDRRLAPGQRVELVIHRDGRAPKRVPLVARLDTPIEVEYFNHGGILPYVLRQSLAAAGDPS
jgi:aconitate hydratase